MVDRVLARSGCRIDLAGGTFDIWPLGVLHADARTVNLAIDVAVEVALARRSSGYVFVLGDVEHRASSLEEMLAHRDTSLFAVIAEAFDLPPVEARFTSASPRGGGLGASSAIAASLIAACERLLGLPERRALERAMLGRDLEARLMGLPTGFQDHLPPMLGGALEIAYRPGGDEVRRLDVDLDRLAECLTIVYSGQSHFSGRTNWEVVRRRLEGDERTRDLFSRICEVSMAMAPALEAGDFEAVGRLVGEEWSSRSQLAAGVSTERIEDILTAATSAGSWGGKAGGAGGGGCLVLLHPAEAVGKVREAAAAAGGEVLDARPTGEGLRVVAE